MSLGLDSDRARCRGLEIEILFDVSEETQQGDNSIAEQQWSVPRYNQEMGESRIIGTTLNGFLVETKWLTSVMQFHDFSATADGGT